MACPECGRQQTFFYEEDHPEPGLAVIANLCLDPACGHVDKGVVERPDEVVDE